MDTDQHTFDSGGKKKVDSPQGEVLNVVVAYEDLSTLLRVQKLFERIAFGLQTGGHGKIRCAMWKFVGPRLSSRMKMAADKAQSADMIVVAAYERAMMPEPLKAWIELWLPKKKEQPCGLIALLDHSAEGHLEEGVYRYLKYVAHVGKLALFTNGSDESLDKAMRASVPCDVPLAKPQAPPLNTVQNYRLDWNEYRRTG